jgi:hypothetical protein
MTCVDEWDIRPYQKFALATLNRALQDARTPSWAGEVRRFFSRRRDRDVLIVLCGLVGEDPDRLALEAEAGALPRALPRQRQQKAGACRNTAGQSGERR